MINYVLPLILLFAGLFTSTRAKGDTWAEEAGSGSLNGRSFPIAVIRNAGSEDAFVATLKQRFGPRYDIVRLPQGVLGYGSQFLVKPFTETQLRALPIRPGGQDQGALERFVLEHSMTFSLLDINGESLAVGCPVAALIGAAPGALAPDSAFPFLKNAVRDTVELSFRFGHVEITSISGTLNIPAQDAKLLTRDAFEAEGMQNPKRAREGGSLSGSTANDAAYQEFFTDGKSRAANVIINGNVETKEVTINVNRVHAKTQSR